MNFRLTAVLKIIFKTFNVVEFNVGTYKFDKPLKIGDEIIFNNVGAYSIVKANMFNGINLSAICENSEKYGLELIKEYLYDDFIKKLS